MPENFSPVPEEIVNLVKPQALPERATSATEQKELSIDEAIASYEKQLGLHTQMDRVAEAALIIDQKFLKADIITGSTPHPERALGDEAWADWLEARLAVKQYGRRPLTPEFIAQIHSLIVKRRGPVRSDHLHRDDMIDGSPQPSTSEQLAIDHQNLQLQQISHVASENEDNNGSKLAIYGEWANLRAPQPSPADLKELCEWYNQQKIEPDYDPYKTAASLHRRLQSLPAFRGSTSRLATLFMDWSLENDQREPAIIYQPINNFHNSEEDWIKRVQFGSQFSATLMRSRKEALESIGHEDLGLMLSVDGQKTFYNAIYRHLDGAIRPTHADNTIDQSYEQFWQHFDREYRNFKAEATASGRLQSFQKKRTNIEQEPAEYMTQGGLIPESYVELVKSGKLLPDSIRNEYFGSLRLFRGGMSSRLLTDPDLCRMFTTYSGIGTGYKALADSYTNPLSPRSVNPQYIAKSMTDYNQALASDYMSLRTILRSLESAEVDEEDSSEDPVYTSNVGKLISIHTSSGGDHRPSPFVSTSLLESCGTEYGNHFDLITGSSINQDQHGHGISITSRAPLYGSLQSFGPTGAIKQPEIPMLAKDELFAFKYPDESEILVAGGINPNAIEMIKVFDNQVQYGSDQTPAVVASREVVDGQLQVIIKNYLESTVKKYRFNPNQGNFELVDESAFDIGTEGLCLRDGCLREIADLDNEGGLSHEKDQHTISENMMAHLIKGVATMEEVEALISNGYEYPVGANINHIDAANHQAVAELLIASEAGMAVITHLDKFKNIDQQKIAEQLIDNFDTWIVFEYFDTFKNLDSNRLAKRLIATDQIGALLNALGVLTNLDTRVAKTIIDSGYHEYVRAYIGHFSHLDESIMRQLSGQEQPEDDEDWGWGEEDEVIEHSISEATLEMLTHLKEGTAALVEIDQLIFEGHGWEVAENIDHINPDIHTYIAHELIASNVGSALLQHLDHFKNVDQKAIVRQLIDQDQGALIFENLGAFTKIDHSIIAHQLMDLGKIELLVMNLESLTNLDTAIAGYIIGEGYVEFVKKYRDHFVNLDESMIQQLGE